MMNGIIYLKVSKQLVKSQLDVPHAILPRIDTLLVSIVNLMEYSMRVAWMLKVSQMLRMALVMTVLSYNGSVR